MKSINEVYNNTNLPTPTSNPTCPDAPEFPNTGLLLLRISKGFSTK